MIHANGIDIHFVEQGAGPLVIFCHGFPESWYSWRHQLPVVADAGFRAVAPSMRGYGHSDAPQDVASYSIMHLVGDVVAVVNAFGEDKAVVVGHDWGAAVAWCSALVRPDLFRAVAGLSVPFSSPRGALVDGLTVTDLLRKTVGPHQDHYRLYFQEPGVAEGDLEADVRHSVLGFFHALSGEAATGGDLSGWDGCFPRGETLSDQFRAPPVLPPWLTEHDLAFYVDEFTRTGFRGGINWYRNLDGLFGALSPWVGTTIEQPALYMWGSTDLIAGNTDRALNSMKDALPDLRHFEPVEGAGHWLQQERPEDVNRALVNFLRGLSGVTSSRQT